MLNESTITNRSERGPRVSRAVPSSHLLPPCKERIHTPFLVLTNSLSTDSCESNEKLSPIIIMGRRGDMVVAPLCLASLPVLGHGVDGEWWQRGQSRQSRSFVTKVSAGRTSSFTQEGSPGCHAYARVSTGACPRADGGKHGHGVHHDNTRPLPEDEVSFRQMGILGL